MDKNWSLLTALLSMTSVQFVWANSPVFQIDLDLTLKGEHVASPQLLVEEGKTAQVPVAKGRLIEVMATQQPNGIAVDVRVLKKSAPKGQAKVLSNSKFLVLEDRKATMTSREEGATVDDLVVSVTARPARN
jgi:hypothetical protein